MTAAELREIRAVQQRCGDRLTAAYASADIEVYPFQVAAAQFALRSPFLKGAVLADESSLGKQSKHFSLFLRCGLRAAVTSSALFADRYEYL
jgi:hypothetical protein